MPIKYLKRTIQPFFLFLICSFSTSATAAADVVTSNPGISPGEIAICGEPICLFDLLGGNPDEGGAWYGPLNSGWEDLTGCGYFDPATDPIGQYSYIILDFDVLCSATITIVESSPISEENNASRAFCETTGDILLDTLLNGNVPIGGTWTNGQGEVIPNIWNTNAGTQSFTYSLENSGCSGSAVLSITTEQMPDAGPDFTETYCADNTTLNLFTLLEPNTDDGGVFIPSSFVVLNQANSGVYTYSIPSANCPSDQAEYTINIQPELQATATTYCEPGASEYNVNITINGGTPPYLVTGANGGVVTGNVFTSNLVLTGTPYNFTISDSGPCPDIIVTGSSPECECPTSLSSITPTNNDICTGNCTNLELNLVGTPPFVVNWSANGIEQPPFITDDASAHIQVCPEETTTYTIEYITDDVCAGTPEIQPITITTNVTDLGIVENVLFCLPGQLDLNQTITSFGTDTLEGTWHDPEGNSIPDGMISAATHDEGVYNFEFSDVNSCITTAGVQIIFGTENYGGTETWVEVCDDLPYICPFALMEGNPFPAGQWIQYDEFGGFIDFFGDYDACVPLEQITDGGYFKYVLGSPPCAPSFTDLHIDLIDGPDCDCQAAITDFSTSDNEICPGSCAELNFTIEGTPPFTITYSDGLSNITTSTSDTEFILTSCPLTNTTYTILQMEDANCVGSMDVQSLTVNIIPNDWGLIDNIVHCSDEPLDLNTVLIEAGIGTTDGLWYYPDGTALANSYVTSSEDSPGMYTFEFESADGCISTAQVNVLFSTGSAGGIETWVDICSTTEFITPFDLLEGNPAPGGTFVQYSENNEFLNFFVGSNVSISLSNISDGDYFTYVLGAPPCSPTFTNLHVNIIETPTLGTPINTDVCANTEPFLLETKIFGESNIDWTWTDVSQSGFPPLTNPFDPSIYPSGATVSLAYTGGLGECAVTGFLDLNILEALPSAGTSTVMSYCESGAPAPFDMAEYLMPETEDGEWRDPYWNVHSNIFDPATDEPGYYFFVVTSNCGQNIAHLEIIATPDLTAESDSTLSICNLEGVVMLDTLLNGTAAPGGQWTDPNGALIDNVIDTETALSGAYTYTLDEGSCAGTGVVNLTIDSPEVSAGADVALSFCENGSLVYLFNYIDPGAAIGGTLSPASTIILEPQSAGQYYYTVASGNSCPNDFAVIDVEISPAIQLENLQVVCAPDGQTYTVIGNLTGGGGTFYSSPNPNVQISANVMIAGPFSTGAPYSIAIDVDGNCPSATFSGSSPDCSCQGANATLSANEGIICQGTCTELLFNFQGEGPHEVVINDGMTDLSFTAFSNPCVLTVCPEIATTYTLVSVETEACTGNPEGQLVSIALESADAAGPDTSLTVCQVDWNLYTYSLLHPDANPIGTMTPSFISFENQVPQELTYVVESDICPSDTAIYDLTFHDLITYDLLETNCDPDNPSTYTVTFETTTGTAPFSADLGTFEGNVFTSEVMSLADSTAFHILVEDANGCTRLISGNIEDTDGDGICDEGEIVGCMNPDAPNYNPLATDPGPCQAGGFQAAEDILTADEGTSGGGFGLVGNSGGLEHLWDFSVFPNPWQKGERLQIALQNVPIDETFTLHCYDMTGRLVAKEKITARKGLGPYPISFGNKLSGGTYIICLNGAKLSHQLLTLRE